MLRIFKSLTYSIFGLMSLGWLSVIFITYMLVGPKDSRLLDFFADYILIDPSIYGQDFSSLAKGLYILMGTMNIVLLAIAMIMSLAWSGLSHRLNIDSPGKAKIYAIHWLIYTGAMLAIFVAIIFFFTKSTQYNAAQFISGGGFYIILFSQTIYYLLIYYMAVIVGTARFARSSVLFANKLPGNFL